MKVAGSASADRPYHYVGFETSNFRAIPSRYCHSLVVLTGQFFTYAPDASTVRNSNQCQVVHAVASSGHLVEPHVQVLIVDIGRQILGVLRGVKFPEPWHIPLDKSFPEPVVLSDNLNAQ